MLLKRCRISKWLKTSSKQSLSTVSALLYPKKPKDKPSINVSGVVKELSPGPLYKRPIRQEPGKVVMGFIPAEWQMFFMPKTGVSGFYTFLVSFGTYLASKEIYVMEHEYYNGLGMAALCIMVVRSVGKTIGKQLDQMVDKYESEFSSQREEVKKLYELTIKHEEKEQWRNEGQRMVVQAKRENVHLQLEANYRRRLFHVYKEVKKRLDYQVELVTVQDRLVHRNIVDWVIREVQKSLTPGVLDKYFDKCVEDLAKLIERHKKM